MMGKLMGYILPFILVIVKFDNFLRLMTFVNIIYCLSLYCFYRGVVNKQQAPQYNFQLAIWRRGPGVAFYIWQVPRRARLVTLVTGLGQSMVT